MLSSLLELSNIARSAAAVGSRESLSEAVSEIERRMQVASNLDAELMHGRKAIDASFNLALAGVSTPWIYDQLAEQAEREIVRWGRRRSCSSMTLCQLGERLAAAGFLASANQPLYQLLGDILAERGEPAFETTCSALRAGSFGLEHSLPAARWINRAAAKQSKVASTSATDFSTAADWGTAAGGGAGPTSLFADPARPLTLDIGCGYGCGALVYAHSARGEGDNVLGCDLSAGGISFARGLATRWGVDHRCAFVRDDARAVLRRVRKAYPGRVHRIILSCPTPYASAHDADEMGTSSSGNSQLPASPHDASFLGNEEVIEDMVACLAPGGGLYLASNVEDVAVTMMSSAQAKGLVAQMHATNAEALLHLALDAEGLGPNTAPERKVRTTRSAPVLAPVPRRQSRWRKAGGTPAIGAPWESARPMLWASETERTHILEERPVHRVVLRKA